MADTEYIIYPDQNEGYEQTTWKFKKGAWTGEDIPIGGDASDLVRVHLAYDMGGNIDTATEWHTILEDGELYYRAGQNVDLDGKFCGFILYDDPTTNYAYIKFGSWAVDEGEVVSQLTSLSSALSGTLTAASGEELSLTDSDVILTMQGINYGASIAQSVSFLAQDNEWQVGKNKKNVIVVDANFPIFDSEESMEAYIISGDLDGCINLTAKYEDNSETYYIYCQYQSMDLLRGSIKPHSGSTPAWHSQRFMANKEPALYFKSTNSFTMGLIATQVIASKHVRGPGYQIDYLPEESWTEAELEYTGDYYGTIYDYNLAKGSLPPDGAYIMGVNVQTNIPIYKNKTDAESGDRRKSINYYDLEDDKDRRKSDFGDEEGPTDFGDGMVTSPFVGMYLLDRTQILNIANLFYTDDVDILDNIKKGLELFGASPYESVVGVNWFPFDVSLMCETTPATAINFGSYTHQLGSTVQRITTLEGAYINAGTVFIGEWWGSYRDFEPYTELSVWLPYHGWEKLEIKKYINKSVNIRYYVDITTCTGIIALVVDNHLTDQFSCNIGVQLPTCGNNLSEYANNMIRTILGAGAGVIGGATTGAMLGGGVPGAIIGGGLGMAAGIAAGTFEMSQKPKPKDMAVTKGNFSAGSGSYMPQYVIFRVDSHDLVVPDNLTAMYGRPSSSGGLINTFSGFLKVNTVKLNTGRMTDTEINEVTGLLQSGIYI